jgi:hypothetical protein
MQRDPSTHNLGKIVLLRAYCQRRQQQQQAHS